MRAKLLIALVSIWLLDSYYIASRMTEMEGEWRGEHVIMYLSWTITERMINGRVKGSQEPSFEAQ